MFDPKEHANWLVNRGVPTDKLECPMCGSAKILRAFDRAALYHVDEAGDVITDAAGNATGINTAAVACAQCGFLRLFVLDVDALPTPEDHPRRDG